MTEKSKLFDFVLVVELQEEQDGKTAPFISFRHPQLFESDPFSASVTQFCFPDMNQFPTEHMPDETFTFVLTDSDGERRFGYCLRKLPPGAGARFPVAFSIMTYFPCFQLYSKVLEQVAYHYENSSMSMLKLFLDSVLENAFPKPGASFEVKMETSGSQLQQWRFTRPDDSDSLLAHVNLDTLLLVLGPMTILSVFASLLVERRTIFISSSLSTLSGCVQTAVALLYPFTWQHIYIPVLPKSLLSFCCAPMPFVVGVLASELQEVLTLPMDEVLIVDLDSGTFIRTPEQSLDVDLLPPNYIEQLRKCLRSTSKMVKKHKKKRQQVAPGPEKELEEKKLGYEMKKKTVELMDTFLQFFVYILGSYKQFISNDQFDKEAFIASASPDTQLFMEMFSGSQMFEMFIQERLHTEYAGGFEKKIKQFEMLNGELRRHFGDDVADSMSLTMDASSRRRPASARPVSKRKFADKSGALFSTLRRGLAKNNSEPEGNLISTPTLVQSTSERAEPPVGPRVVSAPSGSLPHFVVPRKPLPRPPARGGRSVANAISTSTPIRRPPQESSSEGKALSTSPISSSPPSAVSSPSTGATATPPLAPRPGRSQPPIRGGRGQPIRGRGRGRGRGERLRAAPRGAVRGGGGSPLPRGRNPSANRGRPLAVPPGGNKNPAPVPAARKPSSSLPPPTGAKPAGAVQNRPPPPRRVRPPPPSNP